MSGAGEISRQRRRRGVSLVEVLAALALIGAVAPSLNRAWLISMTAAGRSTDEVTAVGLADSRLAESVAAGGLSDGEDSGVFEEPYGDYRWRCERRPWAGDNRLTQVDVTVTWTRRGKEFRTTVTTLAASEDGEP